MGINLADIVTSEPRTLEFFSGKVLAIDAFNTLYQFLAIIRQPDGTPLMDHEGRVTSHLSGIIYRTSNFVAAGIKPAFVFDGEPPRLKARTIVARGEIKRRAEREWREVVKNLAITGRRKLPRKEVYVDVQPEEISLEATLTNLGITREQLVDMGLLIGTDFNEGVKGIGPKKALALIKKHGSLEPALEELHVDIESKDEVREIFLKPNVLPNVELRFRDPDADGVRHMLCDEHDFSPDRINAALAKFGSARAEQKQRSLDSW